MIYNMGPLFKVSFENVEEKCICERTNSIELIQTFLKLSKTTTNQGKGLSFNHKKISFLWGSTYVSFRNPRRTTCLKYLVLANMLMKSGINPFDSQEAKPYKNDPEILAMTNLVSAYQVH
jgi:hypothetical protein